MTSNAIEAEVAAIVANPTATDSYQRALAAEARLFALSGQLRAAVPVLSLASDVERLAEQIDDIMRNVDNNQERSKRAIEIHGKLEVAAEDIRDLRRTQPSLDVDPLRHRVLELTRRLLKDIFTIDA